MLCASPSFASAAMSMASSSSPPVSRFAGLAHRTTTTLRLSIYSSLSPLHVIFCGRRRSSATWVCLCCLRSSGMIFLINVVFLVVRLGFKRRWCTRLQLPLLTHQDPNLTKRFTLQEQTTQWFLPSWIHDMNSNIKSLCFVLSIYHKFFFFTHVLLFLGLQVIKPFRQMFAREISTHSKDSDISIAKV